MRVTVAIAAVVSALVLTERIVATGVAAPQARTAYFTAVDAKGAIVADLTAADIAVKEGGRDCQVVSVAPATAVMDLVLIVDDGGTGGFQMAAADFAQALLKQARFSFVMLNPGPIWMLEDGSQEAAALSAVLSRMGKRGTVRAEVNQLAEVIGEAAAKLRRRKAERPVIVVMSANGEHTAPDVADGIMRQLLSSGAMLNVIYDSRGETGEIFGDGPRQTGGRAEAVAGVNALAPAMTRITQHLSRQYAVSYTLPSGAQPSDRVAVAATRKGVTIVAPSRIPRR